MKKKIRIIKCSDPNIWYSGLVWAVFEAHPISTDENMFVYRPSRSTEQLWIVKKGDYEIVEQEMTADEIKQKQESTEKTEADKIFDHLASVNLTITHFQQFGYTDDQIKKIVRELYHKFEIFKQDFAQSQQYVIGHTR